MFPRNGGTLVLIQLMDFYPCSILQWRDDCSLRSSHLSPMFIGALIFSCKGAGVIAETPVSAKLFNDVQVGPFAEVLLRCCFGAARVARAQEQYS